MNTNRGGSHGGAALPGESTISVEALAADCPRDLHNDQDGRLAGDVATVELAAQDPG